MSYQLRISSEQVNEALRDAFTDLMLLYERELSQTISEPGAFPGYNNPDADIVDTGRLRASQTPVRTGDLTAEVYYPVEYALYVHEGYVRGNGAVVIGRPWTEEAARRLDLEATFARLVEGNL